MVRRVGPPSGSSSQPRSRSTASGGSDDSGAQPARAATSPASYRQPGPPALNQTWPGSAGTRRTSDHDRRLISSISPFGRSPWRTSPALIHLSTPARQVRSHPLATATPDQRDPGYRNRVAAG